MAKMVTIKNDFHGTTARVRASYLTPATVRRVRRTLCGSQDCVCGGPLGNRGSQMQPSGKATAVIEPQSDGTVWVGYSNHDGNR